MSDLPAKPRKKPKATGWPWAFADAVESLCQAAVLLALLAVGYLLCLKGCENTAAQSRAAHEERLERLWLERKDGDARPRPAP